MRKGETEQNLDLMRLIDEQFLETPFGVFKMVDPRPSSRLERTCSSFAEKFDQDTALRRTLALLSALVVLAGFLSVGTAGHSQGYGRESGFDRAASPAVDDVIRGFTEGAQRLCGNVPDPAYTVDCVADYFDWLADRLPQASDFREVESIIRDAASQLNRVARDNASPTKRPAVLRLGNSNAPSRRTSRVVIPVAPERQAAARAAAVDIVKEAETRLLRSAEGSNRRRVAFTSIAAAVGNSSLILLRSG